MYAGSVHEPQVARQHSRISRPALKKLLHHCFASMHEYLSMQSSMACSMECSMECSKECLDDV